MADQLDSDSAPQRKRIAVACGRCRKRKIRCSGDPGHGQPCSNCKNAGVDQCQFLRVSSREAPLRHEQGDFGYSLGDARMYASRTPVGGGLPYTQELPTLGSSDVLGSYRGSGSAYQYTPASKAYYPAMHAYGPQYGEDFEFGLGVAPPGPPVINQEPVNMLPGQWSSGPRSKPPSFSSMYLDNAETSSYGGYSSGGSLLHRPSHPVTSDSPSFSFSGVAASLPLSGTPGPDRLLPNPAGRSSTLPYPAATKPSASGPPSATSTTLADVATAASYAGGFDTPSSLSFSATASSSLSSHPSSSRSNSDTYSTTPESIFGDQERSLQNNGAAYDINGYTASPRRGSGGTAGGSSGASHPYVPAEGAHEAAAAAHHHPSQHHLSAPYVGDAPASPVSHRHHCLPVVSGSGSAGHAHTDDRQVAVATRH
ncbi:hypothetical protein C8A05DRAFT_42745 [Staphylotrichum tortipilum]|uniref:Zn(2)-C6 fungal-type domain-containing protein n=1 Tax=Staphylotrichum tortipilum TaxID=2831512 RepID=A0AAN6RUP7_9PEZI|nr:hypothetical protein C8A05DRAFT_42745 [Staphylotrichum longicolle]